MHEWLLPVSHLESVRAAEGRKEWHSRRSRMSSYVYWDSESDDRKSQKGGKKLRDHEGSDRFNINCHVKSYGTDCCSKISPKYRRKPPCFEAVKGNQWDSNQRPQRDWRLNPAPESLGHTTTGQKTPPHHQSGEHVTEECNRMESRNLGQKRIKELFIKAGDTLKLIKHQPCPPKKKDEGNERISTFNFLRCD